MKRIIFFLSLNLFCFSNLFGQGKLNEEFKENFNKSKGHLYFENFEAALPILLDLEKLDKGNANLNYLIGVCYVAMRKNVEEAIRRLEYATTHSTKAYHPSSYLERNTPIYAYYYLCVGYCYMMRCEDAKEVYEIFRREIQDQQNTYVADARARIKDCLGIVEGFNTDVEDFNAETPEENAKRDSIKTAKIPTRKIIYSTGTPLYGVQIGAFDREVPSNVNDFPNVKNVDCFMDNTGKIRCVVGHHTFRSQAEIMKKVIQEAGYPDAFIVNVRDVRKFSDEVIQPAKFLGRVEYRVQIGAYETYSPEMSEDLASMYIQIEDIGEVIDGDYTLYTAGSFKYYQEAKDYKKKLIESGFQDAFVIAFVNQKKASIEEAQKYKSK